MQPLSVVVLQNNSANAKSLVKSLDYHFRVVNVVRNMDELTRAIPRHSADVAIVDLEFASLDDVRRLRKEFPGASIVCMHRLADERMWIEAVAAGAVDCCASSDVRAIVLAASKIPPLSHSAA